MPGKIRVKAGLVEFEYEGDAASTLSDIEGLMAVTEQLFNRRLADDRINNGKTDDPPAEASAGSVLDLHVNGIAARLQVTSASGLALAAAAYLQLVKGESTFSRNALIETMKAANNYYKDTMVSNLSSTLKRLLGRELNQVGSNNYSLSAASRKDLEGKLA